MADHSSDMVVEARPTLVERARDSGGEQKSDLPRLTLPCSTRVEVLVIPLSRIASPECRDQVRR